MSVLLEAVAVSYPNGPPVVEGLDLSIATNEWVAVIGPNGAGKSTLLKAIAGLVNATGDIALDGTPLDELNRRSTARRVAYVPQEPIMPPGMTVSEYVLLGRTPHLTYLGTESRHDSEIAQEALIMLDVGEFGRRALDGLSGGERQRVVLARALAQEPSILLLDEPTSALDIGHQQRALEQIGDIRRDRPMTILSAMHDLTLAGQFADRLALISGGRIVVDGDAAHVLTETSLATHYGASVEIVALRDGGIAVVPVRRSGPARGVVETTGDDVH